MIEKALSQDEQKVRSRMLYFSPLWYLQRRPSSLRTFEQEVAMSQQHVLHWHKPSDKGLKLGGFLIDPQIPLSVRFNFADPRLTVSPQK